MKTGVYPGQRQSTSGLASLCHGRLISCNMVNTVKLQELQTFMINQNETLHPPKMTKVVVSSFAKPSDKKISNRVKYLTPGLAKQVQLSPDASYEA
jgi:hypothetical protein